ncbi:MAG: sensor histidine kinase [Clostridium sp.]|uniref:sensor histidine kinase n=1 Tax=Clostridium sp. LY3-2 TaxID=2942482 RepID=UPI002152114C|nr:GHKL domain-containing protein [Clostridium sp. LY3-2]MCR6514424.1 GHKL domain-containing protein [Clostridium sp. LY3-2]
MIIWIINVVEILSSILFYNVLFNRDKKKNIFKYVIIAIILGISFSIFSSLHSIVRIMIFLLKVVLVGFVDKKEYFETCIELIIGSIISFAIDGIGIIIIMPLLGDAIGMYGVFFLVVVPLLIIALFAIGILLRKRKLSMGGLVNKNKIISTFIINLAFFMVFTLNTVNENRFGDPIYIQYLISLIALICVNVYSYKVIYKELEEKKELKALAEYRLVLNDLLEQFRANEHEYKNHLATITSIIELSEDKDLIKSIKNYIDGSINLDMYSNLKYIDNVIIKAVVYNKIKECEKRDITFSFDIRTSLKYISMEDSEISIVLNNLLNNAIEAIENETVKEIRLTITKLKHSYKIIVSNTINKEKIIEIDKMFKKGESTKGKGRGYGLFNVNELVQKHGGTIQVDIEKKYLNISIII